MMYKFAPAAENEAIVFGAARPGYRDEQVQQWLEFMQQQTIQRVCCLLPASQLSRYTDLLANYQQVFGPNQVCWSPIEDFQFASLDALRYQILPFLQSANQGQERVVVHCSGGVGRTGHILAAWLVAARGLSNQAAIAAVKRTGKNPAEAVLAAPLLGRNPWRMASELNQLLDASRRYAADLSDG